jgi:hypothetical protein
MSDSSHPWSTSAPVTSDASVAPEAPDAPDAPGTEVSDAPSADHVERSGDDGDRTVVAAAAPAVTERGSDDFDRDRVLRLLDQLEADITAVEAAMVHAESGDSEAFAAAVASLTPQLHAG